MNGNAAVAVWTASAGSELADYSRLDPEIVLPSSPQALRSPVVELWLSVCRDALECASRFGRGKPVAGDTPEELRDWANGNHRGSLSWIADHLSSAFRTNLDVGKVRAQVIAALEGARITTVSNRTRSPGALKPLGHVRKRRARIEPLAA